MNAHNRLSSKNLINVVFTDNQLFWNLDSNLVKEEIRAVNQ